MSPRLSPRLLELETKVKKLAKPERSAILQRFFKTGPGDYGAGDIFLGLMVPPARQIAKEFQDLGLVDLGQLIRSPYHELRLFILIYHYEQSKRHDQSKRPNPGSITAKKIITFYLKNTKYINNWDLVDLSVYKIVGDYLVNNPKEIKILDTWARSRNLWERRMAMIATYSFIRVGEAHPTLRLAEILLTDSHDLIQKAVGWMLREMGKSIREKLLIDFLNKHYKTMPRTSLRYAIEKLNSAERQHYLYG
ncbi:MAG: DNA alkylation repair protein [Candidatus Falkowbacteria bacterium]|nr:DNA alkylation repair protein [Candidatus Falkowbacteria bacterium]